LLPYCRKPAAAKKPNGAPSRLSRTHIASIQLREASEIAKYQSTPIVKSIKDELDAMDLSVKE
jgi:hypothetical protein